MRTFYFEMRNGIAVKDRRGLQFSSTSAAIEHSRELARRLRADTRLKSTGLVVIVLDDAGNEIHREPVSPDG